MRRTAAALVVALGVLFGATLAPGGPVAADDGRCPEPGTGRIVHCHHVVRRGEHLWSIARSNLRADFGIARPPARDVRTRAAELHALNRDVIGPDPSRLQVGIELRMYPWVGTAHPAPVPPPPVHPALDPTFGGGDGIASIGQEGRYVDARAIAAHRGGYVTAGGRGGHVAVARFSGDGVPDGGFGAGGLVTTAIGEYAAAGAAAVQSDGRIVAAGFAGMASGETWADVVLVRYLPDGALDPSFGTDGIVNSTFSGYAAATAVAVQPDGRIVAAGSASGDEADLASDVALLRYLPDGTPDPSFGTDGRVVLDVAGGVDVARSLVIRPDGRLLIAGTAAPGPGRGEFDALLASFLPDGRRDRAFGNHGVVVTDYGSPFDAATDVALGADGAVVTGGSQVRDRITPEIVLARHRADGSLLGSTSTFVGDGGDAAAVAIDRAGDLLVAGQAARSAILLRHGADGALHGVETTPFHGGRGPTGDRSAAFGLLVDDQGRPVVGGCTCDGGNTTVRGGFELPSSIVVARYRARP